MSTNHRYGTRAVFFRPHLLLASCLALLLAACGGGGDTPPPSYTIGGSVTGLTGSGLVLQNNGDNNLAISGNGSFTFSRAVAGSTNYSVTVLTQPTGQVCTAAAGTGTATANVTSVTVTCVPVYTLSGTVSGLIAGSSVVLANNNGDTLTINANGAFVFPTALLSGYQYDVTVGTQPSAQSCFVDAGAGTIAVSDVSNVAVHCPYQKVLFSFGPVVQDGARPEATVLFGADGNIYGTTFGGGSYPGPTINNLGAGTFFKLTPGGTETVLWNFGFGTDGQNPNSDLVQDAAGNFYGMTYLGGTYGAGTVFKISSVGQESVLWNFGSGADGQTPLGNLIVGQDGNLYGTTSQGGTNGYGTLFRVTPTGTETVLWSFGAGVDGRSPQGRLLQDASGTFYGTTFNGGDFGFGTVFKLTLSGTESVMHSFPFGTEGQGPLGLTQDASGDFYGITLGGGTSTAGTAYKITKSGAYSKLHDFGNGADARNPNAALLYGADGNFYGVAAGVGAPGRGALFRLTPSGEERVLWVLQEGDGADPFVSSLVLGPNGAMFGTTEFGGASGGGVVYQLTL